MSATISDAELEARARDFFAQWSVSFDAMCASFEQNFAPGCHWDQRPMVQTRGTDEALRFLQRSRRLLGMETIDVEIRQLAVRDGVVHSARVDHLRRADGTLLVSAPVAGVMVFDDDGKISEWREYFDVASLAGSFCINGAVLLYGKLRALRR